MEIQISPDLDDVQLVNRVRNAESGCTLNIQSDRQFELVKRLMVQHKKVGLRVCLVDEDGYITRQISSRLREEHTQMGFNDKQKSVLKALDRVLEHCRKEGISLIGYSDQMVAVPALLVNTEYATEQSREIDDQGVYFGADSLKG